MYPYFTGGDIIKQTKIEMKNKSSPIVATTCILRLSHDMNVYSKDLNSQTWEHMLVSICMSRGGAKLL